MSRQPEMRPLIERIYAKVEESDGCWVWQGATSNGYGVVGLGRRTDGTGKAHRVLYELLVGPVPPGMELDHLCRNRRCVNPDHLEPVTRQENIDRSPLMPGSRATCPKGHPYEGENLYLYPNGWRACRACHRAWDKEHRRVVHE